MADKTAIWSDGESLLWINPTSGLDAVWSDGESLILDSVFESALGCTIVSAKGGSVNSFKRIDTGFAFDQATPYTVQIIKLR